MPFWSCFSCLRFPNDDNIVKLDYCNNTLSDIPPDISQFERTLEELLLSSNRISDLPPQLFYCQGLRILKINDNELENIPNAIGSLRHLQILDLSRNVISNIPDNIKTCRNLTHLDLSLNNLQRLPDAITSLITLQELLLNETYLEFLPANFGRLVNLRILELRSNNLITLPKSMARLTSLNRIDIGANEFTELPEVIGQLIQLKELWIDYNRIRRISADISNLRELIHFEANSNQITTLPNEISNWKNLEVLSLSTNDLENLPFSIGMLKHLITLKCDNNQLKELPDSICNLTNLEELIINHNCIMRLPNTIGMLNQLRFLAIDENLLRRLPNEICSCLALKVISARNNKLIELPQDIGHLINLRVINIVNNLIIYLPVSVLNLTQLTALWISDNQSQPLVPLQYLDSITKTQLTCFMLPQQQQSAQQQHQSNNQTDPQLMQQQQQQSKKPLVCPSIEYSDNGSTNSWLYLQQQQQQIILNRNHSTAIGQTQSPITSPSRRICFADESIPINVNNDDTNIDDDDDDDDDDNDDNDDDRNKDNTITTAPSSTSIIPQSRLMRSPTPYPKELRLMAKFIRNQPNHHTTVKTTITDDKQQQPQHQKLNNDLTKMIIQTNDNQQPFNNHEHQIPIQQSINNLHIKQARVISKPITTNSIHDNYTTNIDPMIYIEQQPQQPQPQYSLYTQTGNLQNYPISPPPPQQQLAQSNNCDIINNTLINQQHYINDNYGNNIIPNNYINTNSSSQSTLSNVIGSGVVGVINTYDPYTSNNHSISDLSSSQQLIQPNHLIYPNEQIVSGENLNGFINYNLIANPTNVIQLSNGLNINPIIDGTTNHGNNWRNLDLQLPTPQQQHQAPPPSQSGYDLASSQLSTNSQSSSSLQDLQQHTNYTLYDQQILQEQYPIIDSRVSIKSSDSSSLNYSLSGGGGGSGRGQPPPYHIAKAFTKKSREDLLNYDTIRNQNDMNCSGGSSSNSSTVGIHCEETSSLIQKGSFNIHNPIDNINQNFNNDDDRNGDINPIPDQHTIQQPNGEASFINNIIDNSNNNNNTNTTNNNNNIRMVRDLILSINQNEVNGESSSEYKNNHYHQHRPLTSAATTTAAAVAAASPTQQSFNIKNTDHQYVGNVKNEIDSSNNLHDSNITENNDSDDIDGNYSSKSLIGNSENCITTSTTPPPVNTNSDETGFNSDSQQLNKQSNNHWLFGLHKNPTVKQVIVKKDPTLGFEIKEIFQQQGIFVGITLPNTSASSLLRINDKILDVDGFDFTKISYNEAKKVLMDSGPTINIMISRK